MNNHDWKATLDRRSDFVKRSFAVRGIEIGNIENVLDFGGGLGNNIPTCLESKNLYLYEVGDYEPSNKQIKRVSLSQAQGLNFDLILLNDVLEHISYPLEIIHQIRKIIKPNQFLYISVPQEISETPNQDALPAFWHEHLNKFNQKSLLQLLLANNFSIVNIEYREAGTHSCIDCIAKYNPIFKN